MPRAIRFLESRSRPHQSTCRSRAPKAEDESVRRKTRSPHHEATALGLGARPYNRVSRGDVLARRVQRSHGDDAQFAFSGAARIARTPNPCCRSVEASALKGSRTSLLVLQSTR